MQVIDISGNYSCSMIHYFLVPKADVSQAMLNRSNNKKFQTTRTAVRKGTRFNTDFVVLEIVCVGGLIPDEVIDYYPFTAEELLEELDNQTKYLIS
ncbi:MAG: hypothetical protein AB7H97_10890 [Pseudobdellovibrionaceae bacterium]